MEGGVAGHAQAEVVLDQLLGLNEVGNLEALHHHDRQEIGLLARSGMIFVVVKLYGEKFILLTYPLERN